MSFAFGLHFQQSALRLMIDDESFCSLACEHFLPNYFENAALSWAFGRIQEFFQTYSRPPSTLVLYEELRKLDPLAASQFQPTIDVIHTTPAAEADYITANVVEFIRRNIFVERFDQARQLYNRGDIDSAYDLWKRGAEEMDKVDLGSVDRSFHFDDFEDRHAKRQAHDQARDHYTFSTGIPGLDTVLNGGLSLGELGGWIAYEKVGKSMMLEWLAAWCVRALHQKVLVTVHEGDLNYWQARLDAMFSHSFVNNVARGELTPEVHRDLVDEYRMMRGMLVLRGFTKGSSLDDSWGANVGDIDRELVDLKQRFGFVPRMIVTDYADLLRSRYKAETETQHQTAAVRDLKTLTSRRDGYAIWTAFQAQRKDPKADQDEDFFTRARHVADAYGKVRICDFYGSINMTLREKREHRARLLAEGYRGGEAGEVIEIDTDYAHGRMIKSPYREYPKPAPPPTPVGIPGLPPVPQPRTAP